MKIAISYSGGKESALALYKATQLGHTPILLITTFNTDRNHSYQKKLQTASQTQVQTSAAKTANIIHLFPMAQFSSTPYSFLSRKSLSRTIMQ